LIVAVTTFYRVVASFTQDKVIATQAEDLIGLRVGKYKVALFGPIDNSHGSTLP